MAYHSYRSTLRQFQGTLAGAAIASRVVALESPYRAANRFSRDDSDCSMHSIGIEPIDEIINVNELEAISFYTLLTLIPGELWEESISIEFRETVTQRAVNARSQPLTSAIALIPLVLYTHQSASPESELTTYIHSLKNQAELPITLPFSFSEQSVMHLLRTILSQQFSATAYMPSLIHHLSNHHLGNGEILGAVHEAICDRRGGRWLIDSLESIASDQVPSSQSKSLPVKEIHSSVEEAIVVGLILYCFCSSPTQYRTAIFRLKQLIQQSTLSNRLIAPACSMLGAFIGGEIGVQDGWLKRFHPYESINKLPHHIQTMSPSTESNIELLLLLGMYLWALWSGVDRGRLKQLSFRAVDPELITAVPGVIRKFGN